MSNRRHPILGGVLILAAAGVSIAGERAQILHHEPVQLSHARRVDDVHSRLSLDAFGKHFEIVLQPNERISSSGPAGTRTAEPMRGEIEGLPGSWVRLTFTRSGGWQGMLYDGQEFYAMEPAEQVRDLAVQPLVRSGAEPVIYRLSDVLMPAVFCGTDPTRENVTASQMLLSLASEVSDPSAQLAADRIISIGVVADVEFATLHSTVLTSPEEEIVTRMNTVDGIFSTQLGIKIDVPEPTIFRQTNDPFTQSAAAALLDEVRAFRRNSAVQRSRGLTHLITGRDLAEDQVGIAYLNSVCSGEFGVGLSEGNARWSSNISALIAAHEIGHNFNAPHDGEGACASTPQTFLMAAQLNFSNQFSACSIQQIQARAASAACLRPYSPADVAISTGGGISAQTNSAFVLTLTVQALGSATSSEVSATATPPATMTLNSATAANGSCGMTSGVVSCTLGNMDPGSSSQITLNLTGPAAGTFQIPFDVSSTNDSVSSNNSGQVTVTLADAPSGGTTVPDGSGGGGRTSLDVLAMLFLLWATQVVAQRRDWLTRRAKC
jgi:hypothetical protein